MFKFHKNRVNLRQKLGKGAFGSVYAYQKTLNDPKDDKWVVKKIVTEDMKEAINQIQEIVLGFSCQNPYILPVKGYYLDYIEDSAIWDVYIKLPRMAKSLNDVIKEHKKDKKLIPEDQIIKYFYAITKGLQYLHGRGIAHRDIKPDNILLDNEGYTIRIADLGIGNYYGGQTTYDPVKQAGAPSYAAPENLDNTKEFIDKGISRGDLWSLGMVMFELCTLVDFSELEHLRKGAERETELRNHIKKVEGKYSKTLIELILKLLRFEPDKRIGLLQVEEIINENYQECQELKKLKSIAQEKNNEYLGPEVQKRLEQLEKDLKERDQEIAALREENKMMIEKFKEVEKRKYELEEILESKNKIEKEHQNTMQGLALENNQNGFKEKGIEKLKEIEAYLESEWNEEFIAELEGKEGIRIGVRDESVNTSNERILGMIKGLCEKAQEKCVNLRHLSLNFAWCEKITDEGVKELALQIGQKLHNLQHLSLSFAWCWEIKDKGVKELALQIGQKLQNLQHLSLDFHGCEKITDEGVKELILQIGQKLHNLQHLSLGFEGCEKITDEGVKELALQIGQKLHNLQHLSLDFQKCQEIADEGVKELALQIGQKLHNLQHLSLDFYECEKITDEGRKLLPANFSLSS